jgi:hypothetical protein
VLLKAVKELDEAAFDPGESLPDGRDRFAVDLELDRARQDIKQKLLVMLRKSCPASLRCHVKVSGRRRCFINLIEKGIAPHLDGARPDAEEHDPVLALVVHFSDDPGDKTPVTVNLPSIGASFDILPGQAYCFPGSYIRHGTEYSAKPGVRRYSCAFHMEMKRSSGGVYMNEIFDDYYY